MESEGGAAVNKRVFFIRMIACLLALLLAAPCALADLSRGSRGEDVAQLQSMLIDLGFLDDKADGIFGKKTQAAVKAIQRYWYVEETGVADEGVINDLELLWEMAMGIEREYGAPIGDEREGFPAYCSFVGDEEGAVEYCWRHRDQYPIQITLAGGKAPEKLESLLAERICEIRLRQIANMYLEWAEEPGMESIAFEQLELYKEALVNEREVWQSQLSGNDVILSEMMWLDSVGVNLCFDLYGAEKN